MDVVDIGAINSASFAFSRLMAPWSAIFPLATGKWRAYMRNVLDDPVVLYQWSTDNGQIAFVPSYANTVFVFTQNPLPNQETMTLGTSLVQFTTNPSSSSGLQVQVEATLGATLASLLAVLQASVDPQVALCTYQLNDNELLVQYATTDTAGNAFAVAESNSNNAPLGPTLYGAGGLLTLTAPIEDIDGFLGNYVYDVRWEGPDGTIMQIFGGTLTFSEGVTR
jgi:hypothetical protein